MSQEKWLDAARKYSAKQQARQEEQKPAPATAIAVEQTHRSNVTEIANALVTFLYSSEGTAATTLLRVSQQFVRLADVNEGGGCGFVIFLDGEGLKESVEAMGLWTAYAKKEDIPAPKFNSITAQEAAKEIVRASEGRATAVQVITDLRKDLDRIASRAGE